MRVQAAQTDPCGSQTTTSSASSAEADERAGSLVDDLALIGDPAIIAADPAAAARLAAAIAGLRVFDASRRIAEFAKCSSDDGQDWFPNQGRHLDVRSMCADCRVRLDCLLLALRNRETSGIWGGVSAGSRRRLLRLLPARGTATNDASPVASVAGGKETA